MENEKKSEIHITNNFNAPIGQHIDHVDTINFRMDGDGTFHFGKVENVKEEKNNKKNELSEVQLVRAIENCQQYFWGNSSYAVLFCLCRDDYKKALTQTGFERMVEMLTYEKGRDYKCPPGTIANTFSDNPIYKLHVDEWEKNGAPQRMLLLLNKLRKELEL